MMSAGDLAASGDRPSITAKTVFDELRITFSAGVPDETQYWDQFETPVNANYNLPDGVLQLVRKGKEGGWFTSYNIRFFSGGSKPMIEATIRHDGTLGVDCSQEDKASIIKAAVAAVTGKQLEVTITHNNDNDSFFNGM